MTPLGIVHTVCATLALLLGAAIFLRPKGTRWHVRVGWGYAACMGVVNATALGIYHLTGRFNLFHALAIASSVMLAAGLAQVVPRRRPRHWLWRHYQYMCWSFVGLLAGTNNEAFVRVAPLARLTAETVPALPMLVTAGLVVACGVVIVSRQNAVLARLRPGGEVDRRGGSN